MNGIAHFLITRFNVREAPDAVDLVCDESWLARRFELFERFCLPSVRAQTVQDFRWIVFFDAATPPAFRRRAELLGEWPVFCARFVESVDAARVRAVVAELTPPDTARILTTRLDNDDALRRDFLERVRAAARVTPGVAPGVAPGAAPAGSPREAICLPLGYVFHRGRIYLHRDPRNAFASLSEPATGPEPWTVWCRRHTELERLLPVRLVDAPPAWIQVVHGGNRRNRVRGRRRPVGELGDAFSIDPAALPERDPPLGLVLDSWLLDPARALREGAIGVGRRCLRLLQDPVREGGRG